MPFEKGHGKMGGKKKGSKHRKTEQWEKLGDAIMDKHTIRFNSIMAKLNDKDFMTAYLQILEYFKPKLSRSDTNLTGDLDLNINPVEFVKDK